MADEYMPRTEDVRQMYSLFRINGGSEFDRWLKAFNPGVIEERNSE